MRELVVLYSSVTAEELARIEKNGWVSFPSTKSDLIFFRSPGDDAAREFFKRTDSGTGDGMHLLRCFMFHEPVETFEHKSGLAPQKGALRISADDLDAFNRAIQGPIELVAEELQREQI